jgi:serine/threonine protein kinase
VKLIDFGVSKYLNSGEFTGTYTGSPGYSLPQMLQEQTYDYNADVWSLGVLLYRMLTNTNPFPGSFY